MPELIGSEVVMPNQPQPNTWMLNHSNDALLVAARQKAETLAERQKITLQITDALRPILRAVFLSTLGRLSDTERQYMLDASRGHYQTVDLVRVILAVKRSGSPTLRHRLHEYLRSVAAVDDRPILAIERALLRRAIEQAEANKAVAQVQFQETVESIDAAIAEIDDDIAMDYALKASLVERRAKLSA